MNGSEASPGTAKQRRASWPDRVLALAAMTVMWTLLWGDVSWGNVIGGAVVAMLVIAFFPLPPLRFQGRIRPWALVVFLAHFAWDLVVSSAQVAWAAIRPNGEVINALIAVRLRVRSDLNMTLTGEALTLIPGSLIVDADRDTGTLYIHVFDVKSLEQVERFRARVLALEARIVRAIGSRDEVRMINNAAKVVPS